MGSFSSANMFDRLKKKFCCKSNNVHIDYPTFRFHWCFTSSILLVISLFIFIIQYAGTPIRCINSEVDTEVLNDYCWTHSTYTVDTGTRRVGIDVAHPGIDDRYHEDDDRKYVSYYQWVGYILLIQAFLFYLPRIFWKKLEGGKIRSLVKDINRDQQTEEERKERETVLLEYLYNNLKTHDKWAFWYFFCELIAFLNVILQILLTNKFLNNAFLSFGVDVLAYALKSQADRFHPSYEGDLIDPSIYLFPRMTKCMFHRFGGSGYIQKYDALCMLNFNVLNAKIFLFLWCWLFFLGLLPLSVLITRVVAALVPQVRVFLIKRSSSFVKDVTLTTVAKNTKIGDWVLLELLSENLERNTFEELMNILASKLGDLPNYETEAHFPLVQTS